MKFYVLVPQRISYILQVFIFYKHVLLLGGAIEHICEETDEEVLPDRTTLIRASRCLLGAITRVLLLADIVVVKQLLLAKDKVTISFKSHQ